MDRSVAHVHLAIELNSDPIRGLVSDEGALGRSFNGWIELVEAIEGARLGASSIEDARLGASSVHDLRNAKAAKD